MIASIRGLSLDFGGPPILNRIDLDLAPGEIVLLAGTCGSGKTTLLNCLNGVIPHLFRANTKGRIIVNGEATDQVGLGRICRAVGTVLQDPEAQIFNPVVADEIAFGCENLGLDPELIRGRIDRFCDRFRLDPTGWTDRLSGGQKQKLVIASVLAMDQPLLLLDEPLAHLDREGTTLLLALLADFRRAGRTVVVAEHRLDLLLDHVDRVVWLESGRGLTGLTPGQARDRLPVLTKAPPSRIGRADRTPLVELAGVGLVAGERTILDKIDLAVRPGERVALIGPNGAGKTSLLRCLAGLAKPTRGRIGRNGLAPGKGLGYVFQTPSRQLFMASVRDEIAVGSPTADRADRLIDLFGLASLADRHPQSLSEGQKRLVSIAAALAPAPALVCLDEPTVGQDGRSLNRLLTALDRDLSTYDGALVSASHDVRCTAALGDRCLWLDRGRIVAHGGPELAEEYFRRLAGRPKEVR